MTKLKSFDQYVKDAARAPLLLPMPEGDPLRVHFPSGKALKAFGAAEAAQDMDAMVVAFFGDIDGKRLLDLLGDAPADTVGHIITDAMTHFGLDQGNSAGSSS